MAKSFVQQLNQTEKSKMNRGVVDPERSVLTKTKNVFVLLLNKVLKRQQEELIWSYMSGTSLQRIMKRLGLKAYRPQLLHALNEDDSDRRCEFADIFLELYADDSSFPDRIFWTDEAAFKFNGQVNRHNCVYYGVENLHIVINEAPALRKNC